MSPAAKRQRELVEKKTEDALRQGLEAQRAVAAAQAKLSVLNRPRFFRQSLMSLPSRGKVFNT
jgi:hypothetical protein